MSELWIKNRRENDLLSCEVTKKLQTKWSYKQSAETKIWGLNGIRTHDLRDTGAMLYRLNYEASTGAGQLRVQFIPVIKFIW